MARQIVAGLKPGDMLLSGGGASCWCGIIVNLDDSRRSMRVWWNDDHARIHVHDYSAMIRWISTGSVQVHFS